MDFYSKSLYGSCYDWCLDASRALPEFPDVDLQGRALPEGIELEHLKSFQLLYREHCEVSLLSPSLFETRDWLSASQWISVKKLNLFSSWFLLMLCFSSGHSGCYGQPSVSFGGDPLENVLEVQWKSGRRLRNTSCVSLLLSTTKSNSTCQEFSICNFLDYVCFPFKVFQTLF